MVSLERTIPESYKFESEFDVELWCIKDGEQKLLGSVHLTQEGFNEVMESESEKFTIKDGFLRIKGNRSKTLFLNKYGKQPL